MLNFAGVDCCVRLAGYDRYYGQTPSHQNNLACIDGKAYIVEEGSYFLYSDYFDENNCYIGYNTYYASQYPELNREGYHVHRSYGTAWAWVNALATSFFIQKNRLSGKSFIIPIEEIHFLS